jgi:F0F1-type ATP synthase assembly protein I
MRPDEPQNRDPRDGEKSGGGGPSAGSYAGLGLQFLASILIFLYAGQWLDRRFGTKGIITVVSVLLGAGAAFYSLYRRLMADQRRDELRRK